LAESRVQALAYVLDYGRRCRRSASIYQAKAAKRRERAEHKALMERAAEQAAEQAAKRKALEEPQDSKRQRPAVAGEAVAGEAGGAPPPDAPGGASSLETMPVSELQALRRGPSVANDSSDEAETDEGAAAGGRAASAGEIAGESAGVVGGTAPAAPNPEGEIHRVDPKFAS
jgi:hypothetical protein